MIRNFNSYEEWKKAQEEKERSITDSVKEGGMGTDPSSGQQRTFRSYSEWKKVNRPEEYQKEQATLLKEQIEKPRKEYEAKVQEFDTKIQQEKESKWQSKPSIFGWKPLGNIPSKKEKELAAQKAEFTAQTYNKKYSQEYRDKILSEKPKEIKLSDEQYLSLRGDADIRLQYIDMIKDITTTANEDLNKFTQWEVKQTFDGKQTTRKVPFLPTKELVAQGNTYNLQTDWTQAYDYLKKAAKESGMSEEEYARSYNAQISGQMLDIYKKVVGDVSLTKDEIINTTRRTGIPAVDDNQIRIEIENINQYVDTGQRIYEEYAGKREIKKLSNIKEFFSKEGLEYVRDDVLSGTAPFVNMLFNQNQTGFLDTMQLEELKKKLENGGKLTNAETARVLLTEALETNQQIDRGTWTRTAEGVADNLSLIGEMAATWGIFSGASTAVKTTATAATKKISYSAAKEIVEAAASEGGKSWVKTLFTKGAFKEGAKRIVSDVATAMIAEIPETIAKDSLKIASEVMTTDSRISFSDPETEEMFLSIVKEDESYNSDWANKLTKAFARQYFNNVLERGGGEIPEGIIDFGADKLKSLVIAKYISQKGIQTLEEFQKVYDAIGLQGIFGEVFEEYAQDYAESIIDNRDFVIDDPEKFWDIVASVGVMQMGRAGSVATTAIDVTSNIARGITFDTQQQTDQQVPAVEGEVPVDTRTGQDLDTLVTNTQTGESIQDDLQTKEIIRQQQVSGETQTVLTEPVDDATLLSKAQALSDISKQTDYSLSSLTELKKLEKQATDEKTAQAIATISSSYTDVLAKKVADGSVNIGQQIDTQLQDNIKEISPDETVQEGIKATRQQILETPNKEYFVQEKGKFKEIKNAQTVKIINEADTFIYRDPESKLYQVVEAKSGMAIAEAATKSAAVEQATARLNKMGVETFQSKIQEAISKKGVSPRYVKKEVKKVVKKEAKTVDKVQDNVQPESLQEESPIEKAGLKIGSKIKVQGKLREVSEFGKSARDSQGVLVRFTDGTYITLDKAQEYADQKQTKDAIKKESTQKTKEAVKEAEETVRKLEKEKKVDQNQLAKRRMDIGKTNPEVKKIAKDLKDFKESEDYITLNEEYKILLKEAKVTHSDLESYINNMIDMYGEEASTYLEDFMQRWKNAQEVIQDLMDKRSELINQQLVDEGFKLRKQENGRYVLDSKELNNMDLEKMKEISREILGDTNVEMMESILTPSKMDAMGRYMANWIQIRAGSIDKGSTFYHEAVHKALDIFLTPQEKALLIKEVRKTVGDKELKRLYGGIKGNGKYRSMSLVHGTKSEILNGFSLDTVGTGEGNRLDYYGIYFAQSYLYAEQFARNQFGRDKAKVYEAGVNINPARMLRSTPIDQEQFEKDKQWEVDRKDPYWKESEQKKMILDGLMDKWKDDNGIDYRETGSNEKRIEQEARYKEIIESSSSMKDLYNKLSNILGNRKSASEFLASIGFDGFMEYTKDGWIIGLFDTGKIENYEKIYDYQQGIYRGGDGVLSQDDMAEEWLAENIIDYINKNTPKTFTERIKATIDKFIDRWFKTMDNIDTIENFYKGLLSGRLLKRQVELQKQYNNGKSKEMVGVPTIYEGFSKYRADLLFDEEVEKDANYDSVSDYIEKRNLDPDSVTIVDDKKFVVENESGNNALLADLPLSLFGDPKFDTLNQGKYEKGERQVKDPIEVTLLEDGTLRITDGANRFTQAKANEDNSIPAIIIKEDGTVPTLEEIQKTKPKKGTTLELTKAPEQGVVYDTKGTSILPSRKLQQQIEETLMSGQSTPATRSVTAFMPVIETAGKIKDSRAFEKIQDRYAEIQELDPSLNELKYQSMSIADITAKAMAFVDEYPAEARRVALGMELAPEGTTDIAVSLAYTEKMFEEGKWKQAREADRATSFKGTRYGQEIVSFQGRLNANSPMHFVDRVIEARKMAVGKRSFSMIKGFNVKGVVKSFVGDNSRYIDEFNETKKAETEKVVRTLKQIKLEKAEDFINKLIC